MSASKSDEGRTYHTKATGQALETIEKHQDSTVEMTLYGSCFCPFVQRVWVALEALGMPYNYVELDPYQTRPKELLMLEVDPIKRPMKLAEVAPKGLVPVLKLTHSPTRTLHESTVILDYLEDLAAMSSKKTLLPLPFDPYGRALARLAADHVNRSLVPAFYQYLQTQDPDAQAKFATDFEVSLERYIALIGEAENEVLRFGEANGPGEFAMLRKGLGLWVESNTDLGWADIMAAPWLYRAKVVLGHYRGYEFPPGERVQRYLDRVFGHPAFKATCSDEKLYLDSYERYAYNRPNTSQVATAINEGRGLP